MGKEEYREFQDNKRTNQDAQQKKLAKAINLSLGFFYGEKGETMWKNPISGEFERFDPVKISQQAGLHLTIRARTDEDEQNASKHRAQRGQILKQKRENQERIDDSRSSFVFLIWDNRCYANHTNVAPEIMPETLTRLTLLAGFLKWEEQYIMRTNDMLDPDRRLCAKRARKQDIRKMLRLNPATFQRFWADATSNEFLMGNDQDGYQLSPIFYRGRLKGTYAQRIYIAEFRKWYYQGCELDADPVNTKNHRRMGKVLSLIPYMHMEHNVLCYDRSEKDVSQIKPLSGMDIAKRLGGNPGNWKRDLNDLSKLTIHVGNSEQYVFAENSEQPSIPQGYYLNPNVAYFGKKIHFPLLSSNPFFYLDPATIPNPLD